MNEKKLDRRRKYYLVLDCETATLPIAANYSGEARKRIAIAKPLIYDLGWTVIDAQGRIYRRRSYLISEIFSVPAIFNTAHYAVKRPLYLEKLQRGEISIKTWKEATEILERDLSEVVAVGAYNSMFDFKKAIPFTELYINQLYSPTFYDWEEMQNKICADIANNIRRESNKTFEPETFSFRFKTYPLFDLWGLSATHILNCDDFRDKALDNDWITASGKYYSTTAETTFRYVTGAHDFEESHTAIEDAEIESEIFRLICEKTKRKFEMGIIYFPFRIVGRIE